MSDACLWCGYEHRQQYGERGASMTACINYLRDIIQKHEYVLVEMVDHAKMQPVPMDPIAFNLYRMAERRLEDVPVPASPS